MFMQILINSLIAWSLYALVATGFSLTYSVSKFLNFAYGSMVVISGYFLYLFYSILHIPFFLSIWFVLVVSVVLWLLIHLLLRKPMRGKKVSNIMMLIVSLSLMIGLESLIQIYFGANVKTIWFITIAKWNEFLGAVITDLQIVIFMIVFCLFIWFWLFFKKTRFGKAMRALSDNHNLSTIYWLKPENIYIRTTVLVALIAGVGWILIALEQNLEPSMWTNLVIKGFTWAVIWNILSVPWSILWAFLLWLAENFGIWFLPSWYKDAIAFVLLFLFLLVKPKGILAKDTRDV